MSKPHFLQQLYDDEINFKIETFFDNGFNVALGDQMNGYQAKTTVKTFAEAVAWLEEQVKIHFPGKPADILENPKPLD